VTGGMTTGATGIVVTGFTGAGVEFVAAGAGIEPLATTGVTGGATGVGVVPLIAATKSLVFFFVFCARVLRKSIAIYI